MLGIIIVARMNGERYVGPTILFVILSVILQCAASNVHLFPTIIHSLIDINDREIRRFNRWTRFDPGILVSAAPD